MSIVFYYCHNKYWRIKSGMPKDITKSEAMNCRLVSWRAHHQYNQYIFLNIIISPPLPFKEIKLHLKKVISFKFKIMKKIITSPSWKE